MHMPAFGVLLRRVRHNRSVGHAWGSGPAFILRVEQLEDRVVPTNFVVTGTSDVGGTVDTGHAGTPADPFLATTLRAAIEQANTALDADTITFASGLSGQTISLASELLISNNLSISGAGLPLAPILNGGGTTRVLHITAIADVSLDSLVITGGKVTAATTPYASQGGNILLDSGTANITNCAITNGSSNAFGGGICTFVTASLTLVNSTVSGNTAGSGGAGLDVAGSAELTNVTIAGNTNSSAVTTTAGGMWISGSAANSVTIKNTIIAGNTGANPDLYKSGAGTLSVTNSLIGNATGNGLTNGTNGNRVGVAPLLGSLQDNGGATPTIALLTNSPAINAGNNSLVPVGLLTDQRGDIFARKVGTVDMGAFEVQPTQLIVDTLVDESDLDYSGGDLSLREAIQLANAAPGADTITFAAALYSGSPGTIPLSLGELPITNDLTITGPGANLLTIDAKHTSRVFFINDKNLSPDKIVTIDGLTITGGAIPSNQSGGAGIVNVEKLTLRNSTITGNSVTRTLGGGTGGGLLNTGTATIDSCLFSGNYAYRDGGAIGNGGNLTVQNSTLTGNTATDRGGAIASLISFAPVTLQNSTISGNTAGTGGGVYIATGSTLTIQNSLIAGNSASSQGREVRSQGTTSVSGNLFGCSTETTAQAVFGFTPGASNIVATSDGTNTPLSSILGTLQDNGGPTKTFALPSGSPAIDAGDDTLVPVGITTDQRGTPFSRKFGAHVDIGAFEATPLIVDTLADENDGDYSPGDLSLREAIFFANATPGADTITFDSTVFATAKTILLGGTQLTLSDTSGSTTITGPVAGLTIDANNASRVLQVNAGVTASVSGLTFTKGSIGSGDGGGVSNLGTLSLTNCTISGNSAAVTSTHGGGGLFNSGTVTLTNCTLNGNTASIGGDGGGLLNSGTAALANCTISGNTAANFGRYGGGVFNKVAATLTLTNCTISGNSAPIAGSGGGVVNRGTATVTNTIVAGNTATTNADLSGSLTPGSTNNLIGGSPLLGPLENNGGPTQTMALLSGSPAINAGDDSLIAGITTDQRGNPFSRTFGSHVDIGAFEATQSLVVDTLVDVNDGDYSPGNLSLREAIALANATPGADTITFKPGLTGTITLSLGELAITDDVTITGPGANLLTIDANDNSRVFNVDDGTPTVKTVTIDGLTITRGNISTGSKAGGGIFNNENLTVRNSTLSGNTATGGVATGGGAIFSTGALTVQNSTITGNKTTATRAAGGAISVTGGTATIQNSIFTNNSSYYGGALSNRISTVMVTVTGSTFSGNSVTGTLSLGGAIFNARTMTVQNSTLSGNTATTQDGGGAITSVSTLTLLDSTIANNTTTGSAAVGGGLYVRGGTANVGNTIITGNTATNSGPDISGPIASQGHNLIGNTSGATGFVASDLQNVASGLDPAGLQNNGGPTQTIKLIAGSKAIDAGDDTLVPGSLTTDQRGTPFIRKVGTVDIGAFEASRPPTAAVTTPAPDINVATGGTTTNSVTITYTDAGSGVDTRTFGTGNITIDNGATVSSISISGNAVTYYITAPAATWAASTQGTYTISLASGAGAVKSLAGDLVISGTIDSFNVDTLAPTAALTTSASNINVATGGTSTNTVVITYSDVGLGIDSKTFGTDDITVDNGATVTGFSAAGNALTYTITAPAGTWAGSTQGEYTIALVAGSVRDIAGNGVAGNASINSFNVDTVQPTITSISPPVGSPLGGDTIQIRGTGFTTATAVAFGGTPAAFVVNSDTSITVTSPAGAVGIVDVTVTTTGGTSLITPADRFAYVVPTGTFAKVTSVISSITSGRYRVGGVIPVTVNFDQPVTLSGGNLIVLLDSGGSVSITPFSNATHATGTYTVAAGQNSQSLNSTGLVVAEGATLRDGSGNNVNLAIPTGHTLSSTSNLLVDTKRPTVTIEAPSATATTHGPITFTISYADTNFSTNTLTAADITLTKTGTANGTVTVTGGAGLSKTVTISNITGTGTLGISLAAGTGSDTAGNLTAAAGPSTTFGVSNETPTTTAAFAVGGADGTVRLLDDAGNLITTVMPIAGYPGLVSVALGDFNGDTVPDLVVAAANPAGVAGLSTTDAGKVFVYDGAALAQGALTLLRTFTPFANHAGPDGTTGAYTNGLNIAVGDVDGDTHADVIAGTRGKSASAGQAEFGRLVAINGVTGAVIGGVQTPFGAGYQKGVIVAAGNVDGLGGDEIAVTRGGPVANPNPAVQQIKVKVLQLKGTTLSELPLNADGTTAFAPFVGLTGAASGINRDGRVAFVDSNGDGKDELVFTALDPLTNTTNEQVRVGVYAIDPTASKGAATIASTGPDAGTYLTGTAVNDHAITHVAAVGTQENIALLTESASSGVVYLAPLTGAVQTGGFSLNVITGGITVDGI